MLPRRCATDPRCGVKSSAPGTKGIGATTSLGAAGAWQLAVRMQKCARTCGTPVRHGRAGCILLPPSLPGSSGTLPSMLTPTRTPPMAADTTKRPVNLTINGRTLDLARQLGMNLSQTVDAFLATEVQRLYWQRWNEDNKDAIAAYNQRIAEEGLPLAKYRSF